MAGDVYILGGHQTDFAKNWSREGKSFFDMFETCLLSGLEKAKLEPKDIQVGHVGNFVGELFTGQGLLGGFSAMCILILLVCHPLAMKGLVHQVRSAFWVR